MAYTREQFIAIIGPMAREDMKKTTILASLTIAQACLESNFGNSGLAIKANNLFGIKGDYKGQFETMRTAEYKASGEKYYIDAKFRKYPSWQESLADHSDLFNRLSRYANLRGETDIQKACINVRADGYATDPNYPNLLMSLVSTYNLTKYDVIVEDDPELSNAVSKTIKKGIDIDFNKWKRKDLFKLADVPFLVCKLAKIKVDGAVSKEQYKEAIDKLVLKQAISQRVIWDGKTYTENNVRSLLIKYSKLA